jgi:SAM-dependent methyltransferase
MTYQWVDCEPNVIRQRARLADIIPFFDWLFFIPAGLRKHAVDRLSLNHGDCGLDVGCGTGRNFPFLREAIGPTGRIYGVDLSAAMLRNARKLRVCRGVKPMNSLHGFRAPSQRRTLAARRDALGLLRRRLDGEGSAKEQREQKQQRNWLTAPGRRTERLP